MPPIMLCVIGRSENFSPVLVVARMQQKLGFAALGPEHAIARNDALANQDTY